MDVDLFGYWSVLIFFRRYPLPADGSHPEPSSQVRHVAKVDQSGTVCGGDSCGRFEHGACIGDLKQRRELFGVEHFRTGSHHQSMARFRNCSVVNFDQIGLRKEGTVRSVRECP